ncbi:hypothetical protein IQ07DRAFT_112523 [Pyrenochaeta sp. DS3sAY3a]|nr:hypothetical protein IQ07DRAFT_112523 [Pyrenochaeta sp. DS3sAY3a]
MITLLSHIVRKLEVGHFYCCRKDESSQISRLQSERRRKYASTVTESHVHKAYATETKPLHNLLSLFSRSLQTYPAKTKLSYLMSIVNNICWTLDFQCLPNRPICTFQSHRRSYPGRNQVPSSDQYRLDQDIATSMLDRSCLSGRIYTCFYRLQAPACASTASLNGLDGSGGNALNLSALKSRLVWSKRLLRAFCERQASPEFVQNTSIIANK